jgi:hypothetical protein
MVDTKVNLAIDQNHDVARTIGMAVEAGFRPEHVVDVLGIASGTVASDLVSALEQVPGVLAVEEDRSVEAAEISS